MRAATSFAHCIVAVAILRTVYTLLFDLFMGWYRWYCIPTQHNIIRNDRSIAILCCATPFCIIPFKTSLLLTVHVFSFPSWNRVTNSPNTIVLLRRLQFLHYVLVGTVQYLLSSDHNTWRNQARWCHAPLLILDQNFILVDQWFRTLAQLTSWNHKIK